MAWRYKKVEDLDEFPKPKPTTQYSEAAGPKRPSRVERGMGRVKAYVEPAVRAATPFAMDITTMARAPAVKRGKKVVRQQPSPLSFMAPPSYFGGVPGMQPERHTRKKKGKREREDDHYESPDFMGGMMGIPEHARRWM